jgi:transposase
MKSLSRRAIRAPIRRFSALSASSRRRREPARSDAFIPLHFAPGDALQFDWSEEYVLLGGVEHKVHVAHFRLCHSRKPFVVAYMNEKQEMVLDAFVRALAFFGGVPRRVIIDNPKTMVTYVSRSKDRIFHPRFLALMNHYVIEPVACTPWPRDGRRVRSRTRCSFCVASCSAQAGL